MPTPLPQLLARLTLASACVFPLPGNAAASGPPPNLPQLGPDNIRESMIAFVNLSTAPGLDGATFEVDTANRDTDLVRGALGYAADLTLRDTIADAYWGVALAYGESDDEVFVQGPGESPLLLQARRDILSLRGSAGLSLPLTQHWTIRPYITLAASHLETDTRVSTQGEVLALPEVLLENNVDALTTSGTVVASYDRWYGSDRMELSAQYTAAYTDTFNGSDDLLETWGWNETVLLRAAFSWDAGMRSRGRPWRWKSYVNHTQFLGLDKDALGFTYYTELGLGLDHEWNIRPLDWFGLRFLGLKLGFIYGDDVRGVSAGLSF